MKFDKQIFRSQIEIWENEDEEFSTKYTGPYLDNYDFYPATFLIPKQFCAQN